MTHRAQVIRPRLTRRQAECLEMAASLFLEPLSRDEQIAHFGTPERVDAAWDAIAKIGKALGYYEYCEEPEFAQDRK